MRKLLLTVYFLAAALPVFSASPYAVWDGKTLPPHPERVNDYAGLLSQGEIDELTAISANLEENGAIQLVYVIVDSLGGRPIEDYGLFLGRGWGIGQEEKDNGVLIIAAMADRELRIEVGYGLEGSLTDIACGRIIDNLMVPAFRQGAYGQGLADAGKAVTALIMQDPEATAEFNKPQPVRKKAPSIPVGLLVFLIFFLISIFSRFGRRRRGIFWGGTGGWGGGSWSSGGGGFSSSGGGFSGGGGSFGGGGSSGSW